MCHCILVYCVEMLHWDWNAYWYDDSWFSVVEMVHGVVALIEGYGIITDDIQRIDWWEVFMWCYKHYLLIYCLCGTVGTWVKVSKALEENTPMWVYGVGLPLGMSPKRHGALGWCLRIVIIILTVYVVEHWYLIYRLVEVNSLLVVKEWTRKSKDETSKHMHTCLTWLHIC